MVKYQSGYEVSPLSRQNLRDYAKSVRNDLNLLDVPYFPIVKLLESLHSIGFDPDIIDDKDWDKLYGASKHAVYCLTNHIIYIKESVYERAVAGFGRDRFTIAHEVSHVLLLEGQQIQVAKNRGNEAIPLFCDPEWQADCLAGELLVPYHLCRNMSVQEIVQSCKVTEKAARCQKSKF